MDDPPSITFTFLAQPEEEGSVGRIPVLFDQRALFGRARPPVIVSIGGHHYRSTISVMGGHAFVPLRRSHRAAAGVVPGREFPVTLTLDTSPRKVDVPTDLAAALTVAGKLAAFEALAFTRRREHVEAIESARKADTRARRIGKIVSIMK